MRLSFLNKTSVKIEKKPFEKLFKKGCGVVKCTAVGDVGLVFIDDKEMASLNELYRGVCGPTDVLSFSYLESDHVPHDKCVGEIFISVETAGKQAKNGLLEEFKVLFTHGFLHVFGFEHGNTKEERLMESFARKILVG